MAYEPSELAMADDICGDAETNLCCTGNACKSFHLNDLLSLTSGMMLAQEGAVVLHRLVAFVMNTAPEKANTDANLQTVKACIEEQLPFLAEVQFSGLQPIYAYDASPLSNPYLTVWLEMQALRFGEEHTVMTFAAWQAEKESDTANNNATLIPLRKAGK